MRIKQYIFLSVPTFSEIEYVYLCIMYLCTFFKKIFSLYIMFNHENGFSRIRLVIFSLQMCKANLAF